MVTVIGVTTTQGALQESVHHVTQEESFTGFTSLALRNVRKQLLLHNIPRILDTAVMVHARLRRSSLGDEIQSNFTVLDDETFLDTWLQHFQHRGIVPVIANVVENVLIGNHTKCSENNHNRNIGLHVGKSRSDCRPESTLGAVAFSEQLQGQLREESRSLLYRTSNLSGIGCRAWRRLFEHLDGITGTPFLRNKDLFTSVDNEITTRVVRTLVPVVKSLLTQVLENTVFRLKHNRHLSNENCFFLGLVFREFLLVPLQVGTTSFPILITIAHLFIIPIGDQALSTLHNFLRNSKIERTGVGQVSQTGFLRQHDRSCTITLSHRRSRKHNSTEFELVSTDNDGVDFIFGRWQCLIERNLALFFYQLLHRRRDEFIEGIQLLGH